MDKKIMALCFLLLIVVAVTISYVALYQLSDGNAQDTMPEDSDVTDEDLSNEIDDFFLEENEEIEIGDMV